MTDAQIDAIAKGIGAMSSAESFYEYKERERDGRRWCVEWEDTTVRLFAHAIEAVVKSEMEDREK